MQKVYKETPVYAGFFIRLAAFLIDMLLVNVVLCVIKVPVWFLELSIGDSILFKNILFEYNAFDILYYVLTATYFVLSTYCCGATLGKYLMKIKVVSVDGEKLSFLTVLIRETIGRYLSAIIVYIGYIVAGLDNRKQGIHDRISDTYVVYKMMYQKSEEEPAQGRPVMQNEVPPQGRPMMQKETPAQESPNIQSEQTVTLKVEDENRMSEPETVEQVATSEAAELNDASATVEQESQTNQE